VEGEEKVAYDPTENSKLIICYTPKYNPKIEPEFESKLEYYQMEAFDNISKLMETLYSFL